jgi:Flp pilus assembly protein TadD
MINLNKQSVPALVPTWWHERAAGGLVLLLAALALGACSLPQRLDGGPAGPRGSAPPAAERIELRPVGARGRVAAPARTDDDGMVRGAMHVELIETMLSQRQYYAALAHIEQRINESGETPELRYLEAEVRRHLGQADAAESLYRGLLRGEARYAGLAYHGLGLLAADRGEADVAVRHLRDAARRRPTDGEIRNDLGYALMLAGQYRAALPEVATAVELNAGDPRARNNLVMLMMLMKDEASVRRVAAEAGMGADELAQLRQQAQSLVPRRPETRP